MLQRWWLKRNFSRAKVTVNGCWPNQPNHINALVNPCLTQDELDEGRASSGTKPPLSPLRLIFVGQVNEKKGVGRCLEIVRRLVDRGLDVSLEIIGDGPQRAGFEAQAASCLQSHVDFHGWLPRTALGPFLQRAHLMLFPSDSSEGWPKVLSEGMAYGVVPVASNVGSIPQYLHECGVGVTFDPYDIDGFATAIVDYARNRARWQVQSTRSVTAAARFTYDGYLENVSRLLDLQQSSAPL
jgi:glycosyltransferase involved in cell wall biosynthesis